VAIITLVWGICGNTPNGNAATIIILASTIQLICIVTLLEKSKSLHRRRTFSFGEKVAYREGFRSFSDITFAATAFWELKHTPGYSQKKRHSKVSFYRSVTA